VGLRPQRVGDDVVDLTDPAIARHHENGRFVARVCAPAEEARVASAWDLWALFSAKEAAYKVLVKLGVSPGFRHRGIHVAPDLATATWNDVTLAIRVAGDAEHVHALAWTDGPPPLGIVERAGAAAGGDPEASEGRQARAALCRLVAGTLGCAASEIRVVRDSVPEAWDGYGPPRVERAGMPIAALDVSLSHDRMFVAAATSRVVGRP
jgi:phosphopantetheinyl transferase (holo-ACP synthase)